MTVLSACQSAFIRLVGRKPASIFSSTQQMEIEIADLASEVAIDIMKSHEWRALTKFHTITGDGLRGAFDLPPGFDRMAVGEEVTDPSTWLWGYSTVSSLTDWMRLTGNGFDAASPGWWMILDGQMQFSPAPSTGKAARFPYISRLVVIPAGNADRVATFTRDTDSFALDERLLTLGLIWRWKAQKGQEYAEDLASYEKALSQAQSRDGGSRVIRKGRGPAFPHARPAWPWTLG